MDESTDSGKVEDELILIMYCVNDSITEKVKSCARYFSIEVPTKADADGLLSCLTRSLNSLGITNILDKEDVLEVTGKLVLIRGGTDGASVNIGEQNGMKGKLQEHLPWLYWSWCYAHRLKLACTNAASSRLFQNLDEMLLIV